MKKLLPLLLTAIMLCTCCMADEYTDPVEKAVPDTAKEILGDAGVSSAGDLEGLGEKLITALKTELEKACYPALKRAGSVVLISLICAVFGIFGGDKAPAALRLTVCAGISLVCVGDVDSYIRMGSETLKTVAGFSNALLPTLCTAGIISGTPLASAAKYAASALFLNILVTVASRVIMPAIYAYTALVIAAGAFDNKGLNGVCGLLKWLCTGLMIMLTLVFVGYISISSAVSSGGDAVASKVAKTTISMALPVIGGLISDAASSVIAGAQLMKSMVGVFGLFVVLAICIAPFAALGVNYLLLKAASAAVAAFDRSGLSGIINGIAGSFGMILALIGSTGIMVFISIISCIKAVSS